MIKTISISNFRGFRQFELDGCPQINLLTGLNGVGKTAFLEAVFLTLAPTNPELSLRLNTFRGLSTLSNADEAWGWLFHNRLTTVSPELRTDWSNGVTQVLTLSLSPQSTLPTGDEGSGAQQPLTTAEGQKVLTLRVTDSRQGEASNTAHFDVDGTVKIGVPSRPPVQGIFLASHAWSSRDDAQRFSYLEDLGRVEGIVEAARHIEPRLKQLSVAATGRASILRANIGPGRLVPVPLLGAGFSRLVSILLAVASAREGIVLIDEVDAGLHHSRMADVWRSIGAMAREADAQIFATTHSAECVRAAHAAFRDRSSAFRLVRLSRRGDEIVPKAFDAEMLDTAMEAELEVR